MNTTISHNFNAAGKVLSCNVGTIRAETVSQRVLIKLYNTLTPTEYLLLINQYPSNNTVDIYDIASLIEHDLISRGISFSSYCIEIDDAKLEFTVVFCRRKLYEHWLTNNFLTALPVQIIPNGFDFSLQLPKTDNIISFDVTFRDSDGAIGSYSFDSNVSQSASPTFDYYGIRDMIDSNTTKVCIDILIITAKSDNRTKTFFFNDREYCHHFSFRNCFNAVDDFYLCGSITESTKVDSEYAVCNGVKMVYDREVSRSYKFNTGVLSQFEAEALSQLVESHDASIYINRELRRIVFADHSLEFSDDNSSQRRAEFSFEVADGTLLPPDCWLDVRAASNSVFSDQFSDTFL